LQSRRWRADADHCRGSFEPATSRGGHRGCPMDDGTEPCRLKPRFTLSLCPLTWYLASSSATSREVGRRQSRSSRMRTAAPSSEPASRAIASPIPTPRELHMHRCLGGSESREERLFQTVPCSVLTAARITRNKAALQPPERDLAHHLHPLRALPWDPASASPLPQSSSGSFP
jgi:hypothetical protein